MHDLPQTTESPNERDAYSSIYDKTTPDDRRKIDRAIVDRDPPTYRGVFKKFGLAEKSVSFTAFYNYARRIRSAATMNNLAQLTAPKETDVAQAIPRLLGNLLVETLLYAEDSSPNAVHRLTQAYCSAINSAVTLHKYKHVFAPRKPVENANDGCPAASVAENLSDLSTDALLALSNATLAAQKARLAAEAAAIEAQSAAELEDAKKTFCAMGYPVADAKTADELCEIVDHYDPTAVVAPAAQSEPVVQATGSSTPSRACPTDASAADSTLASSRTEISNPPPDTWTEPPEKPRIPLIDPDSPEARDPKRLEELRNQELRRVLLDYGLVVEQRSTSAEPSPGSS